MGGLGCPGDQGSLGDGGSEHKGGSWRVWGAPGVSPAPRRSSGLVCSREEMRCWASGGSASSPSGHRMSSVGGGGQMGLLGPQTSSETAPEQDPCPPSTALPPTPQITPQPPSLPASPNPWCTPLAPPIPYFTPPAYPTPACPSTRRTSDDLAEELLRGVPKEWHAAHQELVEHDAHGPPVHWFPIALAQDHLRCDVLRCSTHLSHARGTFKPTPWNLKTPRLHPQWIPGPNPWNLQFMPLGAEAPPPGILGPRPSGATPRISKPHPQVPRSTLGTFRPHPTRDPSTAP